MPFYHGVMVCHIIFRGAMKRTFYTVLSVRKRCSLLHRKDMRQSMPIFASPMVEIREILCVWKRKVIRQTTPTGLVRAATTRRGARRSTTSMASSITPTGSTTCSSPPPWEGENYEPRNPMESAIFNLMRYKVCLAREFSGPVRDIRKGHFFNVKDMSLWELGAR